MKKIAYTLPTDVERGGQTIPAGFVFITTPNYLNPRFAGMSEQEIIDLVIAKDIPAEATIKIVDEKTLPKTRTERNKLELKSGNLAVKEV